MSVRELQQSIKQIRICPFISLTDKSKTTNYNISNYIIVFCPLSKPEAFYN